jgi:hypothetical protein
MCRNRRRFNRVQALCRNRRRFNRVQAIIPTRPRRSRPQGQRPRQTWGSKRRKGEITAQHVFPAMQQYVGVYGPDGVKGLLSRLGLPMVITACSAPQLMLAKAAFESGASPDKLGLDANGQLVRYQ